MLVTTGLETLARAATSSIEVASNPRSAKICRAIEINCSRRCVADIRTREEGFAAGAARRGARAIAGTRNLGHLATSPALGAVLPWDLPAHLSGPPIVAGPDRCPAA